MPELLNVQDIADMIDHSLLRPELTDEDVGASLQKKFEELKARGY